MQPLTDTEAAMLDLERSWFKHAGAKDEAVLARFGMTPTRYFAVLNVLLDRPEAMAHDAMTVRRLVRLREARAAERATR